MFHLVLLALFVFGLALAAAALSKNPPGAGGEP